MSVGHPACSALLTGLVTVLSLLPPSAASAAGPLPALSGRSFATLVAADEAGSISDGFAVAKPATVTAASLRHALRVPRSRAQRPASAYGLFQLYADEYQAFRAAMGFSLEDYWSFVDGHVARLHAQTTRSNTLAIWGLVEPTLGGGYDWNGQTRTDDVVRAAYAPAPGKLMDLVMVISPGRGAPGPGSTPYPTGHEAEYQAFVRALVERYSGRSSSLGDPAVRVKHWQVMNEPCMQLDRGQLTVEQYASLVRLTAAAVRQADPGARVVLGDVGASLERVVGLLANGGWFDAVDTHFWDDGDDYLSPVMAGARALLDAHGYARAAIWMCEFGTHRNGPRKEQPRTEAEQARWLVKAMLANRAAGARRILWNNLVGWTAFNGDPGSRYNFMGLVSSGAASGDPAAELGREQAAYSAFQRLVATTDTSVADLLGAVPGLPSPLHAVALRRRAGGDTFYVAWADGSDGKLQVPWPAPRARVTATVPDAAGSFATAVVPATGGSLVLLLGQDPVLIEQLR